jgi:hypothetical protein
MKIRKVLGITAGSLLIAWLVFLAFINHAMHQSPEQFGRVMSHMPTPAYFVLPFETLWTRARVGTVPVGGMAPEFDLATLDKTSRVKLSDLRGRPVVLVFGSYT